ncbi:hypothetical protein MBLNU13_g01982t1 [Cladosporium sp. NU13]
MSTELPIPQPPTHFLLGNLPDVDSSHMLATYQHLTKQYGPIFALDMVRNRIVHCGSQLLVNDLCDDTKFEKFVAGALHQVRNLTGTGLFTAQSHERDWQLAHNLLMPAFGPLAIRKMFPQMTDIAGQMLMKWQRFGPESSIDVSDAFTRLTLDTIALCSFDYRFNSFYQEAMHPFVTKALDALLESGRRAGRTDLETRVAGHDTTGGLLSFAFLMMLKHPRVLHLAQAEVDKVLGNGPLDIKHIDKLKYIEAVLRETIRLHPTVTAIGRHTKSGKDELIGGGKYRIGAKDVAILGIAALHRDPAVWGEDANDFRPERMLNGGFEALPPNSWKPFGHGVRACIGRGFAWQEATIAVVLILQRFQVEMADPSYELKIRQTLTIKPVGFRMKVRLRPGKSVFTGLVTEPEVVEGTSSDVKSQSSADLAPLTIFYGSNQGTCKNFAESLQAAAASHGYAATVGTLDSATEHVPTDKPVVFITPSYEGQPPDNGRKFVTWLESIQDKQDSLRGVKYAIFGCGNPDWVLTYHRIPKLIENILDRTGASKFCPTGLGNAAGDIVGAFDAFSEQLWAALRPAGGEAKAAREELQAKITVDRPEMLGEKDMTLGTVRQHLQVADTSVGPRKMMMDVELPGDVTYQAGDYLVVLPTNHRHNVRRVLQRFDMPVDTLVKLSGSKKSFLPNDRTEYVFSIIAAYVEIGTPISRKQLLLLASQTTAMTQKEELERLAGTVYESAVLSKRASIIDLLEQFPACNLSFAAYLDMLQPMKPRQYSIASSPLASPPNTVSILYDVLSAPSMYNHSTRFHGVASTYLADMPVGGKIHAYIRATNIQFRLPVDPATPITMICAGTGLAPMRAFMQERAAIAKAQPNLAVGTSLLYFGCRNPEKDYICAAELEAWDAAGLVALRPCFSHHPEVSRGFKYVGQRLEADKDEIVSLFRRGAKIFLCGSASKLAKSVNEVLEKMVMEYRDVDLEEARAWLAKQKADRYVSDVFG